jgi:hypothetical protein
MSDHLNNKVDKIYVSLYLLFRCLQLNFNNKPQNPILHKRKIDEWISVYGTLTPPPKTANITIIDYDNGNIMGKCHNYSFYRIFADDICLNMSFEKICKIKDILFEKTDNPKRDDLVVYSDSNGNETHFGIYFDSNKIESKWGNCPKILLHDYHHVPTIYGNNISFYTLKNIFSDNTSLRLINNNIKQRDFVVGMLSLMSSFMLGFSIPHIISS